MKRRHRSVHRQRFTSQQRAQLFSAFDRSGLSAAQFAAQNDIGASTLFAWRRRFSGHPQKPPPPPDKKLFKQVSLAQVLGNGNSWAGEVQLPDGTQLRWGSQVAGDLLHEVLAHLRGPC